MRIKQLYFDLLYLFLLIIVLVGIPIAIGAYDKRVWEEKIPSGAKVFTLTGHAQKGWIRGEVRGYDVVSLWHDNGAMDKPVIRVNKGDLVVFKLRSSDVIHGFSLKDFGVFVTDGIYPGKTMIISFKADKVGAFTFSCNAICGDNHQNMRGLLVVEA